MSPSELMSTRCPGRLYRNRNLAARGTVSWQPRESRPEYGCHAMRWSVGSNGTQMHAVL